MRTEEPPGTTRTRSFTVNRRRGKVSLSTKERPEPSPISVSSPSRKPSRLPRFTQAFTNQSLPFFSAARILPCVRASRKSRKVCRAFGSCLTSPNDVRRSMAAFNASMRREVYRERIPQGRLRVQMELLHSGQLHLGAVPGHGSAKPLFEVHFRRVAQ